MLGAFLLSVLAQQANPPKVTFQDEGFVVSGALGTEIVPLAPKKKLADPVDRSKGTFVLIVKDTKVVFGNKGLSLSRKGFSSTNDLHLVPTSGKIATKDSNAELIKLVAAKKRKLSVSALSGWEAKGEKLVLVARWVDADKKPWLEALIGLDLTEKKPAPHLLGKLSAASFAQGTVDDVLVARGDKLGLLGNKDGKVGLCRFAWNGTGQEFVPYGKAVSKAKLDDGGAQAWTLTATPYGTNILGLLDLDEGTAHEVAEIRGKMKAVESMCAVFDTGKELRMVSLSTGAQIPLKPDATVRQTANGLLLWAPGPSPKSAALYDQSFRQLTTWTAPPNMVVKPAVPTKPVTKPTAKTTNVKKAPGTAKKPDSGKKAPTTVKKPTVKKATVAKVPAKKATDKKVKSTQKPAAPSSHSKPKVVVTTEKRPGRG
ncbi:MAG: hypothetical protein JSS66_11695 [Armatimonadetes bacterium]|nr:hypothetical protein [Armatimonadota bacterium]